MAELTIDQKKALAMAAARKRAQSQTETPAVSGGVLPFSKMQDGKWQFDSDAGLLGAVKSVVMGPGRAYRGEMQVIGPDGHISPEAMAWGREAATFASPVNPAMRAGEKIIPGVANNLKKAKVDAPTSEQLLKAGSEGFDAMRATGAEYPSDAVKQMAEVLKARMNQEGFDDITAPSTFSTLNKLASPPENSVATIGGLHSARKVFGKIGQKFNDPSDQAASRSAVNALDEFIRTHDAPGSMAGTASGAGQAARKQAAEYLTEANANYAAGKRSDLIQGIERAADLRAAAANSGQNTGNAIRQRVASALLKEKDTAGFNPAEKDALEGIVRGSRNANLTRDIANRLGGGGGLGSAWIGGIGGAGGAALGTQFGAPVAGAAIGAAIPMALGGALKGASNRITQGALKSADEMIRARSPLYEQMLRDAPMVAETPSKTSALIRALLQAEMQQQAAN